ncbi:unnamed protein product [Rotaria socialis]|uniref:Uncharacterized protein n=2 Tax=Rotaria socialis TaxID=392032 RepID=A0A821ALG5_9BILA|nr:unnamed protein product [Rotaria socialis]CAF3300424.1 unnamed protein product [Rotaria socialis]CAF3325698.1 unnamed protein product [Rotaria socialis]CAF3456796.1 unnamed protein product [Rotaria socialis]CAF3575029.1 unnamed protein product [Rotaria socialis]
MNFNLKAAGTLLSRAKQFTEEKLGQATDRTEYDDNFDHLLLDADRAKAWTERLISNVSIFLQPNPNERLEDFILTKFDQKTNKQNIVEQLGQCMVEAGNDFGSSTQYGSTLIKCGQTHQKLGHIYKDFIQSSVMGYMQPLKSFLEGEMKSITKERRTLEMRRLDLDAARSKQKKSKMLSRNNNTPVAMADSSDADVRHAQAEFERQYHITRLTLDGLPNAQNHHLSCLFDLIESELQYHQKSVQILEEFHKKIGLSKPIPHASLPRLRTAIVKFDYEALDSNELSVLAKETVNIISDGDDSDWVTVEKQLTKQQGRVPRAYLQIDALLS